MSSLTIYAAPRFTHVYQIRAYEINIGRCGSNPNTFPYVHTCIYTYIQTELCTYISLHIHTCMHACMHAGTQVKIQYAREHLRNHACVHTKLTYIQPYMHKLNVYGSMMELNVQKLTT